MKIPTLAFSLALTSCLLSGAWAAEPKGIVPSTPEEVIASPDFKVEHTTKSGIKCYTRTVSPEVFRSIPTESRDHEFLTGDENSGYFLVPIRDGKFVELNTEEAFEVSGFVMSKMLADLKESQEHPKEPAK